MNDKVYKAYLNGPSLSALIAALRDKPCFAILEQPDRVKFPGASDVFDLKAWPSGRVFNEEFEIRWELEGETNLVILTNSGADEPPPGFNQILSLDGPEPCFVWYYLWGEDEVAIGGRLNYSKAIPGKGRGKLCVIEYSDETGRLTWHRYIKLEREYNNA